jgi:hypothetical protein
VSSLGKEKSMSNELDPVVGNWYRHADKGQTFRVVEVDEDEGTITVQHFDGDLEEMEQDAWYELELELAEEPEDWTGPVDDIERDDLGYSETDPKERDWDAPLRENRRSVKEDWDADDEEDEDEPDEWSEGAVGDDPYEP